MKYHCVKQYDSTDCACACLASIAWHYGNKISLSNIIASSNFNREGMNLIEVENIAQNLGFDACAMKKTEDFNESQIKLPCIAHVILEDGMHHFIIIYKIKNNNIIIADPSLGVLCVSRKDFFSSTYTENSQYKWSGIIVFITPNKFFVRKKNKAYRNKIYIEVIKTQKFYIFGIVACSLLATFLKVISSFYFQIIIDRIIPSQGYYSLITFTLLFSLVLLLYVILDRKGVNICLKVSKNINQKLSMKYFNHILKLPISFHYMKKSGELISRFQDVDKIQRTLISSLLVLPVDTILIFAVSIMLFNKSTIIFFSVIVMCATYIFNAIAFRKKYDIYNAKQMMESAKITTHFVDTIEGIETIKAYSIENKIFSGIYKRFEEFLKASVILGKIQNNQSAINAIISKIGEFIVLFFGAIEIMEGRMTIGELVTYNLLIGYFMSPIKNIVNLQPQFHSAKVALGRLDSIIQVQEEINIGKTLEQMDDISFNKVVFGFEPFHTAIEDISINFEKNKKIAIIGNNGSGKTTIAKMILKFYEPRYGAIMIGNNKISDINTNWIRSKVAYVSQEDFIFNQSINYNISFGDDAITSDEIYEAAKLVNIHDFIIKLEKQYETILSERGTNISKGQRQKITLARALVRKPSILILDEATSNMDCLSEREIFKKLGQIKKLTLVVITHRVANVIDSDITYIIEEGKVVAYGQHCELVKDNKIYCKYFEN